MWPVYTGAVCGRVDITALFLPGRVLSHVRRGSSAAVVHHVRLSRTDRRSNRWTYHRCLEYVATVISFTTRYSVQ